LRPSSNVTQQTLNRLLKPFGLRLSIALTHDDLRIFG
jgi:hypothetical protein